MSPRSSILRCSAQVLSRQSIAVFRLFGWCHYVLKARIAQTRPEQRLQRRAGVDGRIREEGRPTPPATHLSQPTSCRVKPNMLRSALLEGGLPIRLEPPVPQWLNKNASSLCSRSAGWVCAYSATNTMEHLREPFMICAT